MLPSIFLYYPLSPFSSFVKKKKKDLVVSFGLGVTGLLKNPAGIVFDEDGFVYVSDFLLSHIVVF